MSKIDKSLERKLGFDSVRAAVLAECTCEMSRRHVDDMSFDTDAERIRRRLAEVDEMCRLAGDPAWPGIGAVSDALPWLSHLRVPGSWVDVDQLAAIAASLDSAARISRFFDTADGESGNDYPTLATIATDLDAAPAIRTLIARILDAHGQVRDTASPQLHDIRRELAGIGNRINGAMRRVIAAAVRDGILDSSTTPTVRDGRLVLPVQPMHKRSIEGIVQGESATGRTCFIEPAEVVSLNNRQRELEIDERHEIIRILTDVANQMRPQLDDIMSTVQTLGYLDFIQAKATYAKRVEAAMPHLGDEPEIELYFARHPVLQLNLERHGRSIVPLDLRMADGVRILVISGPNAGGKSVTLKTVGIVQYMLQCGMLPTVAPNSHMGIFDRIFADIGDDQSIEDDLSTYSSHLRNMRNILKNGDSRSLMLIDEFGSGTEPQIGGAIAQALLTEYNKRKMWGIITTHYHNLKTLADETPGLINGSMLYDRQQMQPLFKLSVGHPGSSFAIEIARKTGLPASIIDEAERIVGSDYVNLDKYLLDIGRDKRYWENKRQRIREREKHLEDTIARYEAQAEELRSQRRVIISDARKEAEQIIAGSNASIERTIHDIRRAQAEREATLEARRKLADERKALADEKTANTEHPLLAKAPKPKKRKEKTQPKASKPVIEVGANVLLDNAGQPGNVLEINGKKATVAFGAMKLTVPVDRLTPTIRKAQTRKADSSFVSVATTEAMRQRQLNFKSEIDVRGMRADEALQAVTYFIDDALQFGINRVRILHGTGTGILRDVLRKYLDTVPGVLSAHDEDVRFGGAGITVVET